MGDPFTSDFDASQKNDTHKTQSSPSMNPVIYLIGLPGTGKSTVSEHLGSQPGFVSITNENIRRDLGFSGYDSKDTEKIRNAGRQIATSILDQGSIPVLDGVCSSVNGRRHDIEFFGELKGVTSFVIFDTQEKSITLAYATRESHRPIIRLLYSALADFCFSDLGCQFAGKTSQGVAGENHPRLR